MPTFTQKSLNGAHWHLPDTDFSAIEHVVRAYDLPEIIARLILQRGVKPDEIGAFLNPTLRDNLPNPFILQDMQPLAEYIAAAILDDKSFAIFGDFDVDGATSSALLHRFFKVCGVEVPITIPDRLTEGYGPNVSALKAMKEGGANIVFLLDCGTTAFDTVAAGRDLGLDIVILDHHEAEEDLPPARFIINPKRKDDTSGLTMLAACGVTFMTCVALNSTLRRAGFWEGRPEPALKEWLDIVALGTVCDMVPLQGVNRLLVRHGFAQMQNTSNTGLQALIDVSRITGEITPYHAGFVLGPRINAGSRVHDSTLGSRLLTLDDPGEAKNIAWTLHDCNEKRKALQTEMEQKAIALVEAHRLQDDPVIIVASAEFHQGLSGLVAGRLKEQYAKPACVIAIDADGFAKGSGRSVAGVHIAQIFIDARAAGLLEKGGGHAMAGGFTLKDEKLEAFKAFVLEHVKNQTGSVAPNIVTPVDGVLSIRGAAVKLVDTIQRQIGPFGQEAPEPIFMFENVRIHSADVVGGSHIRLMVSDWEGGARMKAMAFRAAGTPMGEAFLKRGAAAFNLLGTLKIDHWNGSERVEMHIKDAYFIIPS